MDELLRQLLSCARKAIKQAGIKEESLLGIGVAGSGLVSSQEGTNPETATVYDRVPFQAVSARPENRVSA